MSRLLIILFLFFMGSIVGWIIELFYRRFISKSNINKKWINPGFLIGPYLPLYGSGICVLYLLASIHIPALAEHPALEKLIIILIMTVSMTAIEYVTGLIFIKGMDIKLWDYSDEWGNIDGIICPLYSLMWGALSVFYYMIIHPHIINTIGWFSNNLSFSFVVGFFYGVFVIDIVVSFQLAAKLRSFAEEYNIIVRIESLKSHLANEIKERKEKNHFLLLLHTRKSWREIFEQNSDKFSIAKKIKQSKDKKTK
ncbi:MAG: putative ABC transporter permease [Coprococcus sp.]